ncbi:DUF6479 family protein [Streptomyces sp. NBC_01483]|uniref:DUF6479 family protein n=1 Tax=Streptomyces sp. NBC_01483 TaxID=2903883 RepID=UPI002E2F1669|nr:DUF6479 family protein [Streptomyces sp. NBC_01483]
MSNASMYLAEPSGLLSLGLFLIAVALITLLAGSFWLSCRMRTRAPRLPRPEEQPHMPQDGPVREAREIREPAEIPKVAKGGHALTPYELTHMSTRTSSSQERQRWHEGGSGSFGSGGLGHH